MIIKAKNISIRPCLIAIVRSKEELISRTYFTHTDTHTCIYIYIRRDKMSIKEDSINYFRDINCLLNKTMGNFLKEYFS